MTSYTIASEENFDPAHVAAGFATPDFAQTDVVYPGLGYDRVRRVILYGSNIGLNTAPNTSGFNYWSGQTFISTSGHFDNNDGQHFVMARSVDTLGGAGVTAYPSEVLAQTIPSGKGNNHSIATFTITNGGSLYVDGVYNLVPLTGGSGVYAIANVTVSGGVVTAITFVASYNYHVSDALGISNANLGGAGSGLVVTVNTVAAVSDGTWRRFTEFAAVFDNGNILVNPVTGDFWLHSQAAGAIPCLIYLLRRSDNFALAISPLFPFDGSTSHMDLRGISATYSYYFQTPGGGGGATYLVGTPVGITAAETSADYKLPYFWFQSPINTRSSDISVAVSTNNKVYVFSTPWNPMDFELYRFDEPSAATPYNLGTTGGGFTTITPWGGSTGPNTHAAPYTNNINAGTLTELYYLPATNDLVSIARFYPAAKTSSPTQTDFFFDCTYIHAPDGGGPTFDYHHAFVAGFMDAAWNPLSSSGNTAPANAAYAVIDAQEVDPYISMTSYHYVDAGMDYTKRWVAFTVVPTTPGATVVPPDLPIVRTNNSYFTVFVQYQFVYGAAPAVVNMYVETPWDAQLLLNPDYTGNFTHPNFVSLITSTPENNNTGGDFFNNEIYDPVTNSFWFGAQNDNSFNVSTAFFPRKADGASAPLLRLGFASPPPPPAPPPTTGSYYAMERMDDRLWQSVEDTFAVDAGVSNPMETPAANLYASSATGAVTFTADESVFEASDAGQVLRMSGGIATISSYVGPTQLSGTWVLGASLNPVGAPYAASGRWTLASPVTSLRAPHLAGMTGLVGLADGVPIGNLSATAAGDPSGTGTVTLPFAASQVCVGLPFTVQIQTPYLNGQEVIQGARKAIAAATVRLAASGAFTIGTNQPDGSTFNPPQIAPQWNNMVPGNISQPTGGQIGPISYTTPGGATATALWSGDLRVDGVGMAGTGDSWNSKGQIAIQQTLPLPLQVLAVMPEVLPGDSPEAQRQERAPPRPPQQQEQAPTGPGAWMLGPGGAPRFG